MKSDLKPEQLLLVEDDSSLRHLIQDELEAEGYRVFSAETLASAKNTLSSNDIDLIVTDLRLPDGDGLALLPLAKSSSGTPGFLVITAFGTVTQAVNALKSGADEFLTKPLDLDHFLITVTRMLDNRRLHQELVHYRALLEDKNFHGIVGRSPRMRNLFEQILRVANADGPVLLQGESGTGKELVARAIYEESPRKHKPWLTVNCGGIPGELMESEFFGHSPGAFTGARGKRLGLFQQADGGTLLLDEIGEMPLSLQAKLLRVLQNGEVSPVGSDELVHVDIRILAATNKDLLQAVKRNEFREDLYYRLETFTLEVPPLRERDTDVLLLANHFLTKFTQNRKTQIRGFSDKALQCLQQYSFPGNVRELENAIERAATFCDGNLIEPAHFPERLQDKTGVHAEDVHANEAFYGLSPGAPLPTLEQWQHQYIDYVIRHTKGNKRQAANILGITRRTLYRWLATN